MTNIHLGIQAGLKCRSLSQDFEFSRSYFKYERDRIHRWKTMLIRSLIAIVESSSKVCFRYDQTFQMVCKRYSWSAIHATVALIISWSSAEYKVLYQTPNDHWNWHPRSNNVPGISEVSTLFCKYSDRRIHIYLTFVFS